jgi:hypothetical protein
MDMAAIITYITTPPKAAIENPPSHLEEFVRIYGQGTVTPIGWVSSGPITEYDLLAAEEFASVQRLDTFLKNPTTKKGDALINALRGSRNANPKKRLRTIYGWAEAEYFHRTSEGFVSALEEVVGETTGTNDLISQEFVTLLERKIMERVFAVNTLAPVAYWSNHAQEGDPPHLAHSRPNIVYINGTFAGTLKLDHTSGRDFDTSFYNGHLLGKNVRFTCLGMGASNSTHLEQCDPAVRALFLKEPPENIYFRGVGGQKRRMETALVDETTASVDVHSFRIIEEKAQQKRW